MTTITFNVPNREFGFFKRLTTAQTIRNFMSIMAMLLLALTGGLTLTSCGQEDEPPIASSNVALVVGAGVVNCDGDANMLHL